MTRIALLGAGRIGQVHARAVSSVPNGKVSCSGRSCQ